MPAQPNVNTAQLTHDLNKRMNSTFLWIVMFVITLISEVGLIYLVSTGDMLWVFAVLGLFAVIALMKIVMDNIYLVRNLQEKLAKRAN